MKLPEIFLSNRQGKDGSGARHGATGSGKSTTLAALLTRSTRDKSFTFITLEDPIEFVQHAEESNVQPAAKWARTLFILLRFARGIAAGPQGHSGRRMRDRLTVEIG